MNAVRSTFPETNEFIDNSLKEECEKERMTTYEVMFLLLNLQKKKKKKKISFYKHFCFKFGTIVFIILFIDVERCGR